jgi:P22_AR N-terminal domain.
MTNNTALQVTNFNFYGDELIALKDNATGEIYTSINHVLRNIGFTERQIRHNRDKWIQDIVVSKGVQNFVIPTNKGNQDTYCISNHKLPLALAKITITPKMKKTQSELVSKLELYQDKCADVLASVFIDHKTTDQITIQPILDTLNTFTKTINDTLLSLNERMSKLEESQEQVKKSLPKKRFSYWNSKMFPKYQLLMDHFGIPEGHNGILYKELYKEFHNIYPDIEINQIVDDYCYDNGLESCFTLEAIEHDKTVRKLFESMVDGLLDKYELLSENITVREKTIFDG